MTEEAEKEWEVFQLWAKYEDIAMHFNDLIIRLRTQALGGVAALSALVGIFAKGESAPTSSWDLAAAVFIALCLFWVAIWILDFSYYNKFRTGSVYALLELEKASKNGKSFTEINLSTRVEDAVAKRLNFNLSCRDERNIIWGRWAFYIIVFVALFAGIVFCIYMHFHPAHQSLNLVG